MRKDAKVTAFSYISKIYSPSPGGTTLVEALKSVISLILSGQTPLSIRPFFFGAFPIALEKEGGGIRPIAVGCTLGCLAAKVASGKVMVEMATLLSAPTWLWS